MKTKLAVFAALICIILTVPTIAQQRGRDAGRIPGLSDEQKSKIEVLRTQQVASSTQHRAQMDELRARKRTLSIAENPDMNAINRVIDQMARLHADHMKSNEAHRQQIRSLLTSEQKALFDSRQPNQRQGRGQSFQGPRDGRKGNFGHQQGRRR
jgi:Spy/CpxP family protein refolding chaperone